MATKCVPILNRVILKIEKTTMSAGGLMIAHDGQKSADRAVVVAVGPGMLDMQTGKNVPCALNVGDVVLINRFLGMHTTIDGDEVVIQKEEEILTKVEEV